jgi:hypothetical protein
MKQFTIFVTLFSLLLSIGGLQAQVFKGIPYHLSNLKVEKPVTLQKGQPVPGIVPGNPVVSSKSTIDDPVLMNTRYDLQTNSSTQNRIHLYDDGTIGATGMMAHSDVFDDRGTGVNFFDGSSWGPPPPARIESSKAGWPSYAPWGPNGEIVVTHHNILGLIVCTRPQKGTGTWTESILAGPAGAVDISWPRVITNGPDNMYVHIICVTYVTYQGLTPYALLYYRSLDGGATWETQHRIIEGLTSGDYLGFGGDNYSWANPVGDTIAFVISDSWIDLIVMKSYDNGTNWDKTIVWPCPYNFWTGGDTTGIFYAPDGAVNIALDKYGKAHLASGLMRASGNEAGEPFWYPFTEGIIYWNENMPQMPTVLDPDQLYADGNLIGWVEDTMVFYQQTEQLAYYFVSLTSHPTICVDEDDNVFVVYDMVTVNMDPDNYMLRRIYARGSSDYGVSWTTSQINLTSDFLYSWSECVYPSMSWNSNENLQIVFQDDEYGGVYLNGLQGQQGQTSPSDNDIIFLNPSKMDILFPVSVPESRENSFSVSQNYPNPSTNATLISVSISQHGILNLDVTNAMGQKISSFVKESCTAGNYYFSVSTQNLTSGVYFYTVSFNTEKVTKKMIVE